MTMAIEYLMVRVGILIVAIEYHIVSGRDHKS